MTDTESSEPEFVEDDFKDPVEVLAGLWEKSRNGEFGDASTMIENVKHYFSSNQFRIDFYSFISIANAIYAIDIACSGDAGRASVPLVLSILFADQALRNARTDTKATADFEM